MFLGWSFWTSLVNVAECVLQQGMVYLQTQERKKGGMILFKLITINVLYIGFP